MQSLWFLRLWKLFEIFGYPTLLIALFRYRVFSAVEHKAVIGRRFATLVDIGANRGQFSLAFRAFNPQSKIFAFEPLPLAAAILRQVFKADHLVTVHEVAIGLTASSLEMHVSVRDDSSSLLEIGDLQSKNFPGTQESHRLVVPVQPLSSIISPSDLTSPSILKIDVQGYELTVLKGCGELLECFDCIYCECSFLQLYNGQALASEVIEYLVTKNYRLQSIHNISYGQDQLALQADFLFSRIG